MTGVEFANTLVSSLVLASVFSLVTLGYVVVYRASGVFNFLHPEFMLYGALLFTTFIQPGVLGFGWALLASTVVVTIGACVVYALIVHRAAGQPHWVQMILTMGLAIAGLNLAQLLFGSDPRYIELPFERQRWTLPGGASLTSNDVFIVATGVVVSGVLLWVLTRSSLGVRLRATSENPLLSAYSGIRLGRNFAIAWGIAAAAAVVGGVAYSTRVPVDATLTEVGLLAFPAAMIGGMDSVGGALVGSLILATIQQFANAYFGPQAATAIAFGIVLVILVVRPRGLFGSQLVERV
jgi:branched-chain amino acid transport system permease protein